MTINAPIPVRHDYQGNDIATNFRYSVKVDETTFLQVNHTDINDVEVTLVLDTDYTVTCTTDDPGACVGEGGNVIFPKAGSAFDVLATGEKLTILYTAPVEQTLTVSKSRPFDEDLELKLDYIVKLSSQVGELHKRAMKLAKNSTGEDITVPIAPSRAFAWDSVARKLILVKLGEILDVDTIEQKGDIVQGDASGDPERLPIGADGSILHVVSGLLQYLGIGSTNDLLQVLSAQPAWATNPTLLLPTIADLTKIPHSHQSAGGGGVIGGVPGIYIQNVYVEDANVATGSIVLPGDDTIPQNDEGSEFMNATITPTSVDNLIEIECVVMMSYDEGPVQES